MSEKIKKYVIHIVNSQDFLQRMSLVVNVTVELYRIFISSLLILFVPQNCDGEICTLEQKLIWERKDTTYNTGISFNFITLTAFVLLYIFEISRENKLIKYLEVNLRNPRDNNSLEIIFNKVPLLYRNKIYRIDYYYKKIYYLCVLLFFVNTVLSGIVIYDYSLGNQTTTTFITNVLFMTTKVYDTYYVANTDKFIFYSAYMRDHVQFNDIDPSLQRRISLIEMVTQENDLVENVENENVEQDELDIEIVEKEIVEKEIVEKEIVEKEIVEKEIVEKEIVEKDDLQIIVTDI